MVPTPARIKELLRIAEEAPPASPMARAVRDCLALVDQALAQRDAVEAELADRRRGMIMDIVARVVTLFGPEDGS